MTLIGLDAGTQLLAVRTLAITAGEANQLTAQRCKLVVIQADEDNSSTLVTVGGSDVDADSDPPKSIASLYATQRENFRVHNVSELYVDATASGAKISYAVFG